MTPLTEDQFEKDMAAAWPPDAWADERFCSDWWSALANVDWYNVKTHDVYSVSFRYAGGLIADLRGTGDYMDWYCGSAQAVVSDDIARRMKKFGWISDTVGEICDEPGCYEVAGCAWAGRYTCGEHYRGTFAKPITTTK